MLIHVARIALRNTVRSLPDLQLLARRYRTSEDMQRRLIDVCFGIHTPQAAALVLALEQDRPSSVLIPPRPCLRRYDHRRGENAGRRSARAGLSQQGPRTPEPHFVGSASREPGTRGADSAGREGVVGRGDRRFLGDANAGHVRRGIELAAEAGLPSSAAKLAPLVSGTRFPSFAVPPPRRWSA